MRLYPLTFETIYKEKLWGGQKIKTILNKDFAPLENCGETWEISGVDGYISVVANGELKGKNLQEILTECKGDLVGHKVYEQYHDEFPLLVKFLDAQKDLSVQVHPNDELAKKRHNSFGKTEMWYVMQADENASLVAGLSQEITPEQYSQRVKDNTITEVLNWEKVVEDDVFFIPAGRVHTIGKGCLLAEIQQTSDITYRIYDFDRKDKDGNKRELHVEQALDAIDFTVHPQYKTSWEKVYNQENTIVDCPYFTTNVFLMDETIERDYSDKDSFVILICLEGEIQLDELNIKKGNCVLVPANFDKITLECHVPSKVLEVFIK